MMDRREAQSLDNHITGHYGEDQFKHPVNFNCDWKIGDRWVMTDKDVYILARTATGNKSVRRLCVQFVNIHTGNMWSDQVINPYEDPDWDGVTIPIGKICNMVFGRDISISTTDEDNIRIDGFENQHEYGPEWD